MIPPGSTTDLLAKFPEVIAAGDYRAQLEALRDVLASAMTVAGTRELAAVSKQLADVLQTISVLSGEEKRATDGIDDIAARRAARFAAS